MPTVIPYPLLNGLRFDYSSVEISLNNLLFTGIKELNYKHALEPGVMRGARAGIGGMSRGRYEPDGSITFYKSEYQLFIQTLGPGYMERYFNIYATYAEAGLPPITDAVMGCRLKNAENAHAEGEDVLVVKCDLAVTYVLEGGLQPLSLTQMVR